MRATLWAGYFCLWLALSWALIVIVFPLLAGEEEEQSFLLSHPEKFAAILLVSPLFAPLETLLSVQCYLFYRCWVTAGLNRWTRMLLGVACYVLVGVHVGVNLTLASKWAPLLLKKVISRPAKTISQIHSVVWDSFTPRGVQYALGAPFTLASEILIGPCAACILYLFAKLKLAGEDFDRKSSPTTANPTLIVMVHGNRFNECQWVFGRILLHARWPEVEFMTVNYFSGPTKRDYTQETSTIEGCSKEALKQIKDQLAERGFTPGRVVLMGHSLGGVVSSFIAEHLAEGSGLPITDVVSWSAPLAGSDLLLWAKSKPPLVKYGFVKTEGMETEFCPTNPTLRSLRDKIQASVRSKRVNYFAVTGGCDPLVRPSSALLPECFHQENVTSIHYLGHYNIKISSHAWHKVIEHLERQNIHKPKSS